MERLLLCCQLYLVACGWFNRTSWVIEKIVYEESTLTFSLWKKRVEPQYELVVSAK
jgi:hypothetical protein